MKNDEGVKKIIESINEYSNEKQDSGILLIIGDRQEKVSISKGKGNVFSLNMGFCNQMEQNKEMRELLLAMLGAFLNSNTEVKEDFLCTLSVSNLLDETGFN